MIVFQADGQVRWQDQSGGDLSLLPQPPLPIRARSLPLPLLSGPLNLEDKAPLPFPAPTEHGMIWGWGLLVGVGELPPAPKLPPPGPLSWVLGRNWRILTAQSVKVMGAYFFLFFFLGYWGIVQYPSPPDIFPALLCYYWHTTYTSLKCTVWWFEM